jgi:hypothetical protein
MRLNKALNAMRKDKCSHEECIKRAGFDCCLEMTGEEIYRRYMEQTGACWTFIADRIKAAPYGMF